MSRVHCLLSTGTTISPVQSVEIVFDENSSQFYKNGDRPCDFASYRNPAIWFYCIYARLSVLDLTATTDRQWRVYLLSVYSPRTLTMTTMIMCDKIFRMYGHYHTSGVGDMLHCPRRSSADRARLLNAWKSTRNAKITISSVHILRSNVFLLPTSLLHTLGSSGTYYFIKTLIKRMLFFVSFFFSTL